MRMRRVLRPIAPPRIINRPLLVLNRRSKVILVRPRRRSIIRHPPKRTILRRIRMMLLRGIAARRSGSRLALLTRNVLVIVRVPSRLVLGGLHRLQNSIVNLTLEQRALNVGRVGHSGKLLTRHQISYSRFDVGIVIRPSVKVGEGRCPFLGIVFGHEGEVVGDAADFLS